MNVDDIISCLNDYLRRIDELLRLFKDGPLDRMEKQKAQAMMKDLKECLKNDARGYRAGHLNHNTPDSFLAKATSQASAEIHVSWNSIPNARWCDELYRAKIDIAFMRDKLS